MAIYQLDDLVPAVPATAWVSDSAQVIGNVTLGEHANIWPCAVLRGDTESIRIGARSNVQDGTVIHADRGQPTVIGDGVTIGHQVMLHGCTVGDGSLIGIQTVILNGAKIGKNCLVGAGSLVTEGKEFPDGSMILGSPARVIRPLSPQQIEALQNSAQHYVDDAERFRRGLKRLDVPADLTGSKA